MVDVAVAVDRFNGHLEVRTVRQLVEPGRYDADQYHDRRMTVAEVSDLVGRDASTIRRHLRDGRIKAGRGAQCRARRGCLWLFSLADVARYLDQVYRHDVRDRNWARWTAEEIAVLRRHGVAGAAKRLNRSRRACKSMAVRLRATDRERACKDELAKIRVERQKLTAERRELERLVRTVAGLPAKLGRLERRVDRAIARAIDVERAARETIRRERLQHSAAVRDLPADSAP